MRKVKKEKSHRGAGRGDAGAELADEQPCGDLHDGVAEKEEAGYRSKLQVGKSEFLLNERHADGDIGPVGSGEDVKKNKHRQYDPSVARPAANARLSGGVD